jgi:hypothetical protein
MTKSKRITAKKVATVTKKQTKVIPKKSQLQNRPDSLPYLPLLNGDINPLWEVFTEPPNGSLVASTLLGGDSKTCKQETQASMDEDTFPYTPRCSAKIRAPRKEYNPLQIEPIEFTFASFQKASGMVRKFLFGEKTVARHICLQYIDAKELQKLALSKKNGYQTVSSPWFEDHNVSTLIRVEGPCIIYDKNSYPLVVSFSGYECVKKSWKLSNEQIMESILRLEEHDYGGKPTTTDARNKRKEVEAKQWVYGYFIERGHNSSGPQIAQDVRGSSRMQLHAIDFLKSIGRYIETLGPLIYVLDKEFYEEATNICQHVAEAAKPILTHPQDVFTNTMVIKNKTSTVHWDPLDVKNGFGAIAAFGDFQGGELCFPDLGFKFPHQQGDIMLFRSNYIRHYLGKVVGDRYAVIRFIHQAVMNIIKSENRL